MNDILKYNINNSKIELRIIDNKVQMTKEFFEDVFSYFISTCVNRHLNFEDLSYEYLDNNIIQMNINQKNKCDDDIYQNGECVFVTHTIASKDVEKFVKAIAILSEQPVDWHYFGGRARILTTGNIKEVENTIIRLLPIHDQMYDSAMEKLNLQTYPNEYPRGFPQREQNKNL
jgi:hypothetical protein